jgi:small subunit ribosomal protein S15
MGLAAETKQEIIKKFAKAKNDTGSAEVQIALLTERLRQLNDHFSTHAKDHHSRRGLLKLVGQRKRLLRYLQDNSPESYKNLIADLGIRR